MGIGPKWDGHISPPSHLTLIKKAIFGRLTKMKNQKKQKANLHIVIIFHNFAAFSLSVIRTYKNYFRRLENFQKCSHFLAAFTST